MEKKSGPLICLYGASGTGKTRLLQILENALRGEGVFRTGAESIINEMVDSLRYAEMTEFRAKYLKTENLLVDNLWVLEKRLEAAEEICWLIRQRQAAGKLTVVASDLPEQEWKPRNRRIAEILSGGQSVQLG